MAARPPWNLLARQLIARQPTAVPPCDHLPDIRARLSCPQIQLFKIVTPDGHTNFTPRASSAHIAFSDEASRGRLTEPPVPSGDLSNEPL